MGPVPGMLEHIRNGLNRLGVPHPIRLGMRSNPPLTNGDQRACPEPIRTILASPSFSPIRPSTGCRTSWRRKAPKCAATRSGGSSGERAGAFGRNPVRPPGRIRQKARARILRTGGRPPSRLYGRLTEPKNRSRCDGQADFSLCIRPVDAGPGAHRPRWMESAHPRLISAVGFTSPNSRTPLVHRREARQHGSRARIPRFPNLPLQAESRTG